jgi:hypothetical protein
VPVWFETKGNMVYNETSSRAHTCRFGGSVIFHPTTTAAITQKRFSTNYSAGKWNWIWPHSAWAEVWERRIRLKGADYEEWRRNVS